WLVSGNAIDLGTFKTKTVATKSEDLVSNNPGVELEVVQGECRPDFAQVSITPRDEFGKRIFGVRVTIPPGRQAGPIEGGVVVLRVKGGGQKIRIPLKGIGLPG